MFWVVTPGAEIDRIAFRMPAADGANTTATLHVCVALMVAQEFACEKSVALAPEIAADTLFSAPALPAVRVTFRAVDEAPREILPNEIIDGDAERAS
jgi:hypothetical protein